ncbi:hypothetical protein PTNB73_04561 [Pyrenophora teres f. teres]|nr:hypothetical protein HRS9139_04702 [Pyrenophora teres f. teres]KAE8840155.1 hypothetical protein HRS9122_06760 [Pyrenophora teres f. teres]KAE8869508.1 hypothetical protein PTNB73_04561 [Pyrenophora teres f. teres]
MRTTTFLQATIFALSSLAQDDSPNLPTIGTLKPGIGGTPEALQVSENVGRYPDDTELVTFSRMYNGTQEEWSWRINVTNVPVPNEISQLGMKGADSSEGHQVVNVQWQLGWPNDRNTSLQQYLTERNIKASFGAMISNKPANITKKYENDDNGDCMPLLGEQCVQSLTQSASKGDAIHFDGLEGCADSLELQGDGQVQSSTSWVIDPVGRMYSNSSDTRALYHNDTLLYRASDIAPNSTQHAQALRAVQIFVMGFKYADELPGETSNATVLCRIVNRSTYGALETPPRSGAIRSLRLSMGIVWGSVILSTLVFMWQ